MTFLLPLPLLLAAADGGGGPPAPAPDALAELAAHDVVWTTPGLTAAGSMPLGNGSFGANVWIDERGDLLLLLSHTDAFSECERLLKLGRVRIACDPPLDTTQFTQRLAIGRGALEIAAGRGASAATLDVFFDVETPTCHVTIDSAAPRAVRATLERWRTGERRLEGAELPSSWLMRDAPTTIEVKESGDVVVEAAADPDAVTWYHHNSWSMVPFTLDHQGLLPIAAAFPDPLLHRTFGARLEGEGMARAGADALVSEQPARQRSLRITAACAQTADATGWLAALGATARGAGTAASARARTATWWGDRFSRSWVFVETPAAEDHRAGFLLTQCLANQRFVTLAAARGGFPIKFNGSIFTVEPKWVNGAPFDPDFRNWGGDYWWQNTRLAYHGMLARGDGDHMGSLFNYYDAALPACTARAQHYYGAAGAYFPETMTTFATYSNGDYGWDRAGAAIGDVHCPYWQWAWNQGPELVAMMLDHFDHTGDAGLLRRQTLPVARAVLEYFDSRFRRDAGGLLVISPTQSAETYWKDVVNDLPTVAGLREVTARLCALPAEIGSAAERALWERMRAACPPIPLEADASSGAMKLSPAERYAPQRSNCESPELYAVWPFQHAGVGRRLLEEGRRAYAARHDRFTNGWPQDGMDAARLGLADEAAANVLAKIRNTHAAFRFPTFWGPNFDWVPDQCHGGNLLTTVQEMLLQPVGDRILLLPAWPKAWNVRFRLHAPQGTAVTAEVRDGAIVALEVEPPERRSALVAGEGWVLPGR